MDSTPVSSADSAKKYFSAWKVLLPVAIGLSAVILMFVRDAGSENMAEVWKSIRFDTRSILCIGLAFIFMLGRDFGLSWRFRHLSGRELSWGKAFKTDFLCEFTSCVTPTTVGGSSLGMIFLNSQGIEFGRATTLVMTGIFLDELFYVIFCPLVVLLTPAGQLFASGNTEFSSGIRVTFWIVYSVLALWDLILFLGIFVKPAVVKRILVKIFSLRLLRRWQPMIGTLGDNMVTTSAALRHMPFGFWAEAFAATVFSWLSRFLVVNALFLGFIPSDNGAQLLILARQFVLWVVMTASPTPGGSGLSEWLFSEYYGDLVGIGGLALIMAVFWRLISYYLYLFIGAAIVPGWIRDTYKRIRSHSDKSKRNDGDSGQ